MVILFFFLSTSLVSEARRPITRTASLLFFCSSFFSKAILPTTLCRRRVSQILRALLGARNLYNRTSRPILIPCNAGTQYTGRTKAEASSTRPARHHGSSSSLECMSLVLKVKPLAVFYFVVSFSPSVEATLGLSNLVKRFLTLATKLRRHIA